MCRTVPIMASPAPCAQMAVDEGVYEMELPSGSLAWAVLGPDPLLSLTGQKVPVCAADTAGGIITGWRYVCMQEKIDLLAAQAAIQLDAFHYMWQSEALQLTRLSHWLKPAVSHEFVCFA